jgi:hypothetical protein
MSGGILSTEQAADALRAMKRLVDEALARDSTLNTLDVVKMAEAKHTFLSAARLGARATAARATSLDKDHNALARRLLDKHDDHRDSRSMRGCRSTTTQQSVRSE